MTRKALIVGDGSAAFTLPALRSLTRAGWKVGIAQPQPGLATRSRWCHQHYDVPRVEDDQHAWLQALQHALTAGGYDLVFPADDIELLALSAARHVLTATVPYPSHDLVLGAIDKLTLTHAAQHVGLAVPVTVPASPAAIAASTEPMIVKARLHWTPDQPALRRHLPVQLASTHAQMRTAADHMRSLGGEPILQQVIDGELCAVTLVMDRDGKVVTSCHQRTLRASTRRTSARARTTAPDPELEQQCVRLLRSLHWWGPANLQFLRGPDQIPRLIDLNARFYGSLALTVAAGADLPAAWAAIATHTDPGSAQRARPGVRFQALDEDLLALRTGDRAHRVQQALAVAYSLGAAHSIWDRRDPAPAAARAQQRARRLAGRLSQALPRPFRR